MPRCGRLRSLLTEYNESPRAEKLSFVLPFLILTLELILLTHALIEKTMFVLILISILLTISIFEIILVSIEMHEEYLQKNYDKILTIKLDDFITEKKKKCKKNSI